MPTTSHWRQTTYSRPTHFISIPLINPASRSQFGNSVSDFKQRLALIKTGDGEKLVPDEAVKPVGSLHLTIGVLDLRDEERFQRARRAMNELDLGALLRVHGQDNALIVPHFTINSLPLIRRGQISPSPKAFVIFLDPCDPEGRLVRFCSAVLHYFRERGLIHRPNPDRPHARDSLTLHATLINMRQKRPCLDPGRITRTGSSTREHLREQVKPINATPILNEFGSWKWAENVRLDRVALCEVGCRYEWTEEGDFVDGQYKEILTLPIGIMEPNSSFDNAGKGVSSWLTTRSASSHHRPRSGEVG